MPRTSAKKEAALEQLKLMRDQGLDDAAIRRKFEEAGLKLAQIDDLLGVEAKEPEKVPKKEANNERLRELLHDVAEFLEYGYKELVNVSKPNHMNYRANMTKWAKKLKAEL